MDMHWVFYIPDTMDSMSEIIMISYCLFKLVFFFGFFMERKSVPAGGSLATKNWCGLLKISSPEISMQHVHVMPNRCLRPIYLDS